ncbi:putative MATE family efflux protein [Breznakia sp. PH1-1]|uniref:MATE family efflux transporter n=1 Tax=Breznakia sp. PFB1-11 TaxID=2940521 RepID=UPI00247D59BC|nr:putative MATE family efflux protein [Breznakia sp. PH1-1]MDH6405118.1 putative MATE family efflux protein [Breznakia sp. PF1-11]MDH6412833.1 putative MATE family efflux protein [Breznakia sp. PFB1-11]MDH6415197.1 putative MATE family efflux protein [Breznakia sp. PFB1-14]MDH6417504.1 putative MATE family efflux protein [Breznakia sp. PFB1-4]MDH6419866.1 putative MATE family efflux protein [Breznakia sp. PFB1-12]MDH6474933.1 putative MATE family efflux protein [Breznakia sp. PFB2-30]MDH647
MNGVSKSESTSMTEGPIWQKIAFFAMPLFLGNTFQQLYNAADSLIVGNFLGSSALAAVSSSGNLIFLMVGFFNGIAMGAGVVIARFFGAKDYDSMSRSIHTTIAFGLVAGVLLTILGTWLAPIMLDLMGTPEKVMPQSIEYFRIYFIGSLGLVMYNIFVGILQAIGDSKHPLYYLIISSLINVVLDLFFIAVLGMGVGSAAIATIIAQFVSALLCLHRLTKTDDVYKVNLREVRFHKEEFKLIIDYGLPSGFQNSIIAIANVVVQSNINFFGENAMAGCGAFSRIEGFAFLPISSFTMALTTFVGQNLGAENYERTKKGAKFGMICSVILAEIIGILVFIFAPMLIALFNNEPEVVAFGTDRARTASLFFCLLAYSHCISAILRGAGKSFVPMIVMMICWCLIRVSFLTIMGYFFESIISVYWVYPLTWGLSSLCFFVYYHKVDWMHGFKKEA